jgi:hypothetical protein
LSRLLPAVLLIVGGLIAHRAHRQSDAVRFSDASPERIFLPSAGALKVASMGYHTVVADFLWVRSVLTFSEIFSDSSSQDVRWLDAMLTSVAELDPSWRTVYFNGGGMLRICNAIDESDALFLLGMENLPDEPYFPFSVGMNAYLYRGDRARAAEYLSIAAKIPGAPPWYSSAAAGFLDEDVGRQAAMRYLKEQLETTAEPAVRRSLERKLNLLLHEELVERIAEHREELASQHGQDITTIQELGSLPPEPLGGEWILAPDGVVRSSVADAQLARKAKADERWLLTVPWDRF